MEKYVGPMVLLVTGYLLLNLSPTLEPLFLFKMFFGFFFSNIELYILHALNITGLILVIYSTVMIIYKSVKK